ncbi:MAG: SNF2-related protein [Verrucomicrobiales bacterium]
MSQIELSLQFLFDTGGWKEMKEARAIHAAGRVSEASYRDGVLEGLVREGSKSMRVRMEIRSRTEVVNHCPCFRTRRDGIICAHALATGLEVLDPAVRKPEAGERGGGAKAPDGKPKVEISPDWPALTEVADDKATPARLFLVVAPNLATAWEKGRITVGVEVDLDGERSLLKSVTGTTTLFLDTGDAFLYRALQQLSPNEVPGVLLAGVDDFSQLLAIIPGHPGVTLGKGTSLQISPRPIRPPLKRLNGLRFRVEWTKGLVPLIAPSGSWVFDGKNRLQPVAHGLEMSAQALLGSGMTLDPADFPLVFRQWQEHFETAAIELVRLTPEIRLELEGSLNHLDADLSFVYRGEVIAASEEREPVWENEGVLQLADTAAERAALAEIEAAGFVRRGSGGRFVLKDKAAILQFLAYGYPAFQKRWQTQTGERFDHALGQVEPITTTMHFRPGGEDWFALEVDFGTPSGESVSRQEIQRLLQMGQSSKTVAGGKIAVLDTGLADSLGEIINDCDPQQLQPGTYRVDQAQAGYLRETVAELGFGADGALPWKANGEGIEFYALTPELSATLRPYQQTGVEWMKSLASQGMGGILADDMGLGKTLQTLAFIQSVGGSALVVCPSSLVHNWVAEAEKFVPDLNAVAIEGPDREKTLKEQGDADILVTSYALLRRDEEWYRDREFDVVILDEAQNIKNPEAQISQAAHRLKGTYRFALTGTPIENSAQDLWSIARFALPGYLGSKQTFTERFVKPLGTSEPAGSVRERLARRLRPVILRRLKSEVARDLPEKIEQVVFCDLKPKQREVYAKLLQESKTSLIEAQGGRKRMLALTALLRLRQTCCDLRLLGLREIEEEEVSVKAEVLAELLDEALEGGHRVLVFSQFVEMLQLIVPQLAAKKIDFCYLDGQTKNRAEVVKRFQTKEVPVFLISLKAGGVGLNLTGADTVIHVDPWWNPAVEAQATDRAHRIGQDRVVTSYKLITRNTVEEKILSLQNRKRALTESLLAEAGDAHLSEGELMSLFE